MPGCLSGGRGEWWEGGEGQGEAGGGRRDQGGNWNSASLIKTGVNFFSPSLRPKGAVHHGNGEHRGGGEPGLVWKNTASESVSKNTSTVTNSVYVAPDKFVFFPAALHYKWSRPYQSYFIIFQIFDPNSIYQQQNVPVRPSHSWSPLPISSCF